MTCSLDHLATQALPLWDMPQGASACLINLSENATYLVEAPDAYKAILRLHRPNYHTADDIACELAWIDALARDQVIDTPPYFLGRDGKAIQTLTTENGKRHAVLFRFIQGTAPSETGDLSQNFRELGTIAAKCHLHVQNWTKPAGFQRFHWDTNAIFGPAPIWGDWRDAPGVTPALRTVLERVETQICARLAAYGRSPKRYNLIHADMRLANLLIGPQGTRVIDFDDCGFGWCIYDFAAAISFIEDDPRIPAYKAAWLDGYQSVRPLSGQDIAEIDTMIMLRRMALLAWIGSHIEAPKPQKLAPSFAENTAQLGQSWLDGLSVEI